MAENMIRFFQFAALNAPSVWVQLSYHVTVSRHSHEFYELVYIREGFCLHDVDDKMTLLTEGDLFLIKPGQFHRYIGNRVVSLYNCLFSSELPPESLRGFAVFSPESTSSIHLELSERKTVTRLLSGMQEELKERLPGWETKLRGMLDSLLVDYARMVERRVGTDGHKQAYTGYVLPALEFIDRNFQSELSVKDIAGNVGVSSDYLTRQFRQVIGITPLEYLRRYRFARAMELLSQDVCVTDAAEKVGFGSLSHFSREFKKELGITPSKYRVSDH